MKVSRLSLQAVQLKTVNEGILKMVSAIEHATIDKIMTMEDGELALAVLSGKIKPLRKPCVARDLLS